MAIYTVQYIQNHDREHGYTLTIKRSILHLQQIYYDCDRVSYQIRRSKPLAYIPDSHHKRKRTVLQTQWQYELEVYMFRPIRERCPFANMNVPFANILSCSRTYRFSIFRAWLPLREGESNGRRCRSPSARKTPGAHQASRLMVPGPALRATLTAVSVSPRASLRCRWGQWCLGSRPAGFDGRLSPGHLPGHLPGRGLGWCCQWIAYPPRYSRGQGPHGLG